MRKEYLKYIEKKFLEIKKQYFNKYSTKKFFRENKLIIFFIFLFFILFVRLFWLQVVQADYYEEILYSQHFKKSSLDASRGNIYVKDKAGNKMQLTKNITLYNMYVDPKFIQDKQRLVKTLSPLVYRHLCKLNGLEKPDKTKCIKNIESFTNKDILPDKEKIFYISGEDQKVTVNLKEYKEEQEKIKSNFSSGDAISYISDRLTKKIKSGNREKNYFGFFNNKKLLSDIKEYSYISIENNNYVYFIPGNVSNINKAKNNLYNIFRERGYNYGKSKLENYLSTKEIRYIKLVSDMSSKIAREIKQLKKKHFQKRNGGVPFMHGVGLEEKERRYYPYGSFMSHILGYVDDNGKGHYGIEQYFNNLLNGESGKIKGLSVPWIGTIGSKGVEIDNPINGSDLYLTIDPTIQKEIEKIAKYFYSDLSPDSLSILVMNPNNGKVKSSVNYPNFDPNFYKQEYKVEPLTYEDRKIIDDKTYMDIPILIATGGDLKKATFEQRDNPNYKKYIFKNLLGPQIFVDKNISFPYEPGSIFKAFTVAIGLDANEISLYDFYEDGEEVEIGPYTIRNVSDECDGTINFLNALEWSCNVGMVRIAQKVKRHVFYNYLEKLGFGKKTGIELALEDKGTISALNQYSKARFFNNSFGQGILVTPMQIAMGYSAMVNGGYLIKPTVIDQIYDKENNQYINKGKIIKNRIFTQETAEKIKKSLYSVVKDGGGQGMAISGYTLGGKTGTSQIAFKGKYQSGKGWTNGSFVGIVTKENLDYVVVVQVRRPRKCEFGSCSAGKVFKQVAKYLIKYKGIDK